MKRLALILAPDARSQTADGPTDTATQALAGGIGVLLAGALFLPLSRRRSAPAPA
jgi:hypothetical protein